MELNKVEVKAKIGGTDCYIISMRLEQGFNCHHTFELVVDYNDLDSLWMESPGLTFNLLGEEVKIEMQHRKGDGINLFTGVITQVSYIGHHGGQNHIRVSGCSPTIKLDGSKTMDSFMDMTLDGIVAEAVGTSGNGGEVTPQTKFKGNIDYICQYDETCFEFLNRLSWIYGEWFFFDGEQCYFGKQDGKQEEITFESEMMTFDLSANLVPSKMKRYHYLVHDDLETNTKAPDPSVVGYHTVAQGQSSTVYTSDAILSVSAVVLNDSELETVAKAEKNRATFSMLTISGTSQTSKVKIGGKVLVKLPKNMKTTKKEVDTFLVTSVIHEYDLKAEYRNTFRGIPDIVENIPMRPVDTPKAYSQLATVKTNEDDKKLGRVKVQTQWQKASNKTTNWIRVQTPDAGKSDIVPKNRGFVFIPEKDDIVMLDFEYGDPNRPYVAGSIFSEKVSIGGNDKNKIKSITTRVDSSITFDDDKGSITIKDKQKSDSTMTFDGNKNIHVNADNSILMTSGKSSMLMQEDGTIIIKGVEIYIDGSTSCIMYSGKASFATTSDGALGEMDGKDLKIRATNIVDMSGRMQANIDSYKLSANGTMSVDITGGIVKINS